MKQVRFTSVVEQSGKPEVYLLLIDPKKDPNFQAALKAHRVMTIQSSGKGSKTNFGTPGYAPGPGAQVLIFPRGLTIPEDAEVVGIKFDLLDQQFEPARKEPTKPVKPEPAEKPTQMEELPPVKKAAAPVEPRHVTVPERQPHSSPAKPASSKHAPKAEEKIVPFNAEESAAAPKSKEIAEIKVKVRRALKALEAGKQVVAFNLLKEILEP